MFAFSIFNVTCCLECEPQLFVSISLRPVLSLSLRLQLSFGTCLKAPGGGATLPAVSTTQHLECADGSIHTEE